MMMVMMAVPGVVMLVALGLLQGQLSVLLVDLQLQRAVAAQFVHTMGAGILRPKFRVPNNLRLAPRAYLRTFISFHNSP
ncbi:hypothetical protein D3C76_1443790 [compost metagenome]